MRLTIKIATKAENAFMRDRDSATKHSMPLSDNLSPIYVLQQIEFLVARLSLDADNASAQMQSQSAQSLEQRHPKDPQAYHAYGQGT